MPISTPNSKLAVLAPTSAGIVGQGAMGTIIAAILLAAGHQAVALALTDIEFQSARRRVRAELKALNNSAMNAVESNDAMHRLKVVRGYEGLASCSLVIESIIEDLEAKRTVISEIEKVVGTDVLIGSNTSALPISGIQQGARHSDRIMGVHFLSLFSECVEIMGGESTSDKAMAQMSGWVRSWNRIPVVINTDTRGFIANRIFYAMLREALALRDAGVASADDIDRVLQSSIGSWLPHAGLFRYLDLNGLTAYPHILRDMLPDLSCSQDSLALLEKLVAEGAEGLTSGRGFYEYTPQDARHRRRAFDEFRREIAAYRLDAVPDRMP